MPRAPEDDRRPKDELARQRARIASLIGRSPEPEPPPTTPLSGRDMVEKIARDLREQRARERRIVEASKPSAFRRVLNRWVLLLCSLLVAYVAGLAFVTVFVVRDAGRLTLASQVIFRTVYYPVMYGQLPGPVLDAWYAGAVWLCRSSPDCRIDEEGLYVTFEGEEPGRIQVR